MLATTPSSASGQQKCRLAWFLFCGVTQGGGAVECKGQTWAALREPKPPGTISLSGRDCRVYPGSGTSWEVLASPQVTGCNGTGGRPPTGGRTAL
jgi:hypothetical protein